MNWFNNKKLLVPWDYSKLSLEALREARTMADSPDKILVLHVTAILSANEPGVVWGTYDDDQRIEHLQNEFLTMAGESAESVEFRIAFGDPGSQITKIAEDEKVDAIVIPSHGRTGLKHLLIGSVAERVVRLATCPVFVLRN